MENKVKIADEEVVKQKVADAVKYINEQVDQFSLSLVNVGKYLLENFFDGDVVKARSRAPRKDVSLRKLASHPDLSMSFSGLSRAVSLAVQDVELSSVDLKQQLSATHQVALLSVEQFEDKVKYAEMAVEEGISVARLRKILERDGHIKPRGLGAIENEDERKLLRSGEKKLLEPFKMVLDLDVDKLLNLGKNDIQSTYDSVKEAKDKVDVILGRIWERVKNHPDN